MEIIEIKWDLHTKTEQPAKIAKKYVAFDIKNKFYSLFSISLGNLSVNYLVARGMNAASK